MFKVHVQINNRQNVIEAVNGLKTCLKQKHYYCFFILLFVLWYYRLFVSEPFQFDQSNKSILQI